MTFRFVPAGESVLTVEGPDRLDPEVNRQVTQLAAALDERRVPGVRDIVPGFRSLAVYFDPLLVDRATLERYVLEDLGTATGHEPAAAGETLSVPVCYGGALGPDLGAVAAGAGLSEAEVIGLHSGRLYRVYMLGFLPGFAYLAAVDDRIAAPRRPSPRVRVPAGSVGIAGVQTGIYPVESPGGWQLVGRTPLRPFDPQRAAPFLFRPGDEVRFYPITQGEYSQMGGVL